MLWRWLQDYTKALQEEDYAEAARLRDQGAAGLRGWWVADNQEDPRGHLLRITTGFGRYMGYAYTPHDLAQAEVCLQKLFNKMFQKINCMLENKSFIALILQWCRLPCCLLCSLPSN